MLELRKRLVSSATAVASYSKHILPCPAHCRSVASCSTTPAFRPIDSLAIRTQELSQKNFLSLRRCSPKLPGRLQECRTLEHASSTAYTPCPPKRHLGWNFTSFYLARITRSLCLSTRRDTTEGRALCPRRWSRRIMRSSVLPELAMHRGGTTVRLLIPDLGCSEPASSLQSLYIFPSTLSVSDPASLSTVVNPVQPAKQQHTKSFAQTSITTIKMKYFVVASALIGLAAAQNQCLSVAASIPSCGVSQLRPESRLGQC